MNRYDNGYKHKKESSNLSQKVSVTFGGHMYDSVLKYF